MKIVTYDSLGKAHTIYCWYSLGYVNISVDGIPHSKVNTMDDAKRKAAWIIKNCAWDKAIAINN